MTAPRTYLARAATLARGLPHRPLHLVAASAVLIVIGLLAVLTDHLGLAIAVVLVVQGLLVAGLRLDAHRQATGLDALHARLDRSDARVLGDIARLRQTLDHPEDQEDAR
jgi:hypothetical protein